MSPKLVTLKPEVKKRWVDLLNSGTIGQSYYRLEREDGCMCALGVLNSIYREDHPTTQHEVGRATLPKHVGEWATESVDERFKEREKTLNDLPFFPDSIRPLIAEMTPEQQKAVATFEKSVDFKGMVVPIMYVSDLNDTRKFDFKTLAKIVEAAY